MHYILYLVTQTLTVNRSVDTRSFPTIDGDIQFSLVEKGERSNVCKATPEAYVVDRVKFTSQDGKASLSIGTRIFDVINMPQDASYYAGLDTSRFENPQTGLRNFKIISSGPQAIKSIDEIFAPPQGYKVEYTFTDPNLGLTHALRVFIVSNAPYILYVLTVCSYISRK